MAYPDGWGRKCKLTIDYTKTNGVTVTDLPVLLTVNNLPSEMFDADGSFPALNGGGDIRFSSDALGTTRLPCEIVSFVTDNDPANGLAEIWVKIPSVSGTVDTDFYIWYNKAGESQPAASDTYGSQNVWDSNYVAVYHCSDATTSTTLDSTSYANNITKKAANTPSEIAAKWSGSLGQDFDTDEYMYAADDPDLDGMTQLTIQTLCKANSLRAAGYNVLVNKWINGVTDAAYLGTFIWSQKWGFYLRGTSGYAGVLNIGSATTGTWYWNTLTYQSGLGGLPDTRLLVNAGGYGPYTINKGPIDNCTDPMYIGNFRTNAGYNWDGIIDEVRISKTIRNINKHVPEWNNMNSPSTFLAVGTPETPSTFGKQIIMIS